MTAVAMAEGLVRLNPRKATAHEERERRHHHQMQDQGTAPPGRLWQIARQITRQIAERHRRREGKDLGARGRCAAGPDDEQIHDDVEGGSEELAEQRAHKGANGIPTARSESSRLRVRAAEASRRSRF